MKKSNFQLSAWLCRLVNPKTFNLLLSMLKCQLILLLFAASCTNTGNISDTQTQNDFTPDSLWTPTGDAKLDSLLQLASVAPQDTNLAKLCYQIGEEYYNLNEIQQAKDYYNKGYKISENYDWYRGICLFTQLYSEIYNRQGDVDSAILISERALALAKEKNNELDIAIFTVNIGIGYAFYMGWYETAFTYFFEALPILEKLGDKYRCAHLYDIIGSLYGELSMFEEQLIYQEKALEIYNEKPDDLLRAVMLGNYAAALAKYQKEYDKAEDLLNEALRIFTLHNNKNDISFIYSHFSGLAWHQHDMDKSEMYNRKYFEMIKESNNIIDYTFALLRFSNIELNKGNYKKSKEYVNETLQIAIENDLLDVQRDCYKILSVLSILQNDFKSRILYDDKADSIEIYFIKENSINSAAEMEAKYETAKKDLEIENQKNIISRQNKQRWFWTAGIVVCVVFLVLLWYMLRLRNRRNRALSEQNASLAEMNATKNKFFSIISHDLKNPALLLRDALKTLIKNSGTWDFESINNYYNDLLKSAEGQIDLIYNLLDWSQIQTERISVKSGSFLFSDIIKEMTVIFKMAENKGITVKISDPEEVVIKGDSYLLATVIRNLLTNAIKFSYEGGVVTLSVSATTPTIISVTDKGSGMSKQQKDNLFRLDNPHPGIGTSGEKGTGLGLIICKDFLEKHGATLHVESEEGKGSRFWFELGNN